MPFFSIIIPLYNKEDSIDRTLQSVLVQTHKDYEIVIINDGSTDSSEAVVSNFKDQRIRYLSTENRGVSRARNLGIEKSKGVLIAFLDADDYWYPNHLEILYQLYLKYPKAGLYTTTYEKRFHKNSIFLANFKGINSTEQSFMIVDDFFDHNTIDAIAWTSVCAVPKNILVSIGGFDMSITHGEDTDLWIRIALKHQVTLATYITAIYHLDTINRSEEVDIIKKRFLKFSKFVKEEKHNLSLKKYLDYNRYAIAMQYKMSGDDVSAKRYFEPIDQKNLNWKHRILIRQSKTVLRCLKRIQTLSITLFKIKLSSFE